MRDSEGEFDRTSFQLDMEMLMHFLVLIAEHILLPATAAVHHLQPPGLTIGATIDQDLVLHHVAMPTHMTLTTGGADLHQ